MKERKNSPNYIPEILCGLILSATGVSALIANRDSAIYGVSVPLWTEWMLTPMGFYILYLSFKALWQNKQKGKKEAEAAALEEKEREAHGDVGSGADESESKKDEPPQGGA